jgi:hypothetical protein
VSHRPTRPGNTPVEPQERAAADVERTRPVERTISGPGAADFLTAQGGLDTPESGTKGTGQTRDAGLLDSARGLRPRLGPDRDDPDDTPGEHRPEERLTGSQTGTVGGGGYESHNPSPIRATDEGSPRMRDNPLSGRANNDVEDDGA